MKTTLNCITLPTINSLTTEEYIIYAARVSSSNRLDNDTAPKLMKYLIDHGHWSPFEMISIGIEIETSRAIAQQMLRHRSFSFQEFSQRYAKVTKLEPVQLREQAETNRQSSVSEIEDDDLKIEGDDILDLVGDYYNKLIDSGVAKECARMYLPLTTSTTVIMHGTLRSWIHFFNQRCSEHAQLEIQDIAYSCRNIISKECPWTASALNWR